METVIADTILISDLHLGSEVSRADAATMFLRHAVFNRLVLLGDIFCDLNFRRLKKQHWEFLSLIRKLSNPKRGVEVVWVEGNHDRGLSDVMSHLVGIKVYEEYSWRYNGLHYLAVHGHQFDRFLINNRPLSSLGELLYLQIQKIDLKNSPIAQLLDRLNSRWLRLTPKVADGALTMAQSRGADVVFCGHTHQPFARERGSIRYFNTGCWIHDRLTYIAVDANGARLAGFTRGGIDQTDLDATNGHALLPEMSAITCPESRQAEN
jgi:UDP-2,3-diacylglucosamine pyrophosphatase LpxH